MHGKRTLMTFALLTMMMSLGCETAPETEMEKQLLQEQVQSTIRLFKQKDPGIAKFFDTAAGYAVFPEVVKGGAGIGGAHGQGILFHNGEMIGYCSLSQATLGLQLGGQGYSEVIFFENDLAVKEFKTGEFALSAQASAVAAKEGASTTADYERGVLVFTMTRGGLMFEASVGGQKFDFVPR